MKWKIAVVLVLVAVVAVVVADVRAARRDADEDRSTMLEMRKDYVRVINERLSQPSLSLAGAEQDILLIDASDCGPNLLRRMVGDDTTVGPIMTAGFHQLRCKNNPAAVQVPEH